MCCSVLQFFSVDGCEVGLADLNDQEVELVTVAVCCIVLQCVAVRYNVLQFASVQLRRRRAG